MPRNEQGVYNLPVGNPVVTGTTITSTWANSTMPDMGGAITGSLPRNGSAPMTGPLILARNAQNDLEAVTLQQLNTSLDDIQPLVDEAEGYRDESKASADRADVSEANAFDDAQNSSNCRQESYNQAVIATTGANTATTQAAIATAKATEATTQADRAEGYADTIGVTPYVASSVMANGEAALSLTTASTLNFATTLYTGNGTSQSITTGINSCDFTISGNGSGYWLDRTVDQVKTDGGVVVANGTANWGNTAKGVSKVHIKCRSLSSASNIICDGIRGQIVTISTDTTGIEVSSNARVSSFNSDGFTVGSAVVTNSNLATYVAYQELFTHIKWGTTNHGKFFIEAYNPITGGGMVYYVGSGLVDHQIPHSQGVELAYTSYKNLSSVANWLVDYDGGYMLLNKTDAAAASATIINESFIKLDSYISLNQTNSVHVCYYKRKSSQWTIKQYTGSGVAGNYVELGFKPSRVIIKAISAVGDWLTFDSKRGFNKFFTLNESLAERYYTITVTSLGVTLLDADAYANALGVTYIILAEADTHEDGEGAYYPRPTDGLLNVNGGYFSYTNGLTDKGYDASIRTVTKSIDPTGQADGFKWVSENSDGTVSYYSTKPSYSWSTTGIAFKLEDGKWYNNNTLMSPAPSFLPKPVFLAGGKAQYLGDGELATNVMPRTAFPNGVDFTGDGWDYEDPDAIGANPVAKMYPDGTIVGSTVNGSYVKYPNGDLLCYNLTYRGALATSLYVTGLYLAGIAKPVPCTYVRFINTLIASAADQANNGWACGVSMSNGTQYSLKYYTKSATITDTTIKSIAIGRWK